MPERRRFPYWGFLRERPDDPNSVLVVSSDAVNRGMQPVVAQVTRPSRPRTLPTYVVLEPGDGGLPETSYVLCHELATLEDEDLSDAPLGPMIPLPKLVAVERALMAALDINCD